MNYIQTQKFSDVYVSCKTMMPFHRNTISALNVLVYMMKAKTQKTENARSFPRLHVRCGTAFLIMVMIIAIFVYTITPLNGLIAAWGVPDGPAKLALVIVVRILLMPVIAGISYEITVKWAGSHPENPLVKVVLWPGMQMQRLTTNEPDDEMLECAIAAMQRVLEREEREEAARA